MSASMRFSMTVAILAGIVGFPAAAQKTPDNEFRHPISDPAYALGAGPAVCFDEGHENHHRSDGSYAPFVTLVEEDGFQVEPVAGPFTRELLSGCDILVSANPLLPADQEKEGQYPHNSAFTEAELNQLLGWIQEGGSFLFIVDHTPWAGAASDLLALLGIQVFDGQVQETAVFGELDEEALKEAASDAGVTAEWLRQRLGEPGDLSPHPIVTGRAENETISSVWTFNGSALYPSANVEPLLTLGPDATGITALLFNWPVEPIGEGRFLLRRPGFPPDTILADEFEELDRLLMPTFPMGGWLHAAALTFGEGRAVVLADGAMCTAQYFGGSRKIGMNTPMASENARFCLNTMRWLSGLLNG